MRSYQAEASALRGGPESTQLLLPTAGIYQSCKSFNFSLLNFQTSKNKIFNESKSFNISLFNFQTSSNSNLFESWKLLCYLETNE